MELEHCLKILIPCWRCREDRARGSWQLPPLLGCARRGLDSWNYQIWLDSSYSVLRIPDILVRIRIRGSVPLPNASDPAIFVIDLQDGNKKYFFSSNFFLLLNSRNQCFSYYFCLMIEGSESVPLTNRSGWPKNIRILRIRIHNTARMRSVLTGISKREDTGPHA